jgi:Cys-tRNA(Pro)/Cys-tRNA(Cys) deacylase
MAAVTPAIIALDAAGIEYGVHPYDHGGSDLGYGLEAAAALGVDPDEVFKTLLVDGGRELAVAIVPVTCRLSLKAVALALGSKRVEMCDPERAEHSTGYVVGGISPIGQRRRLPTVIDESAELYDRIYVSGGRRGLDLSLAPADLVALLDATVAPITA